MVNKVTFVYGGDGDDIDARAFATALGCYIQFLQALDAEISRKRRGSSRWVVDSLEMASPARVSIRGRSLRPGPDFVPAIIDSSLEGIERVEKGEVPEVFTEETAKILRKFSNESAKAHGAIRLEKGSKRVSVTSQAAHYVDRMLTPRVSLGNIEGTLETITIHDRREFRVYETNTGIGVPCVFEESQLDEARNALGKRVSVFGEKRHDEFFGRVKSLKVLEPLQILREEKELPSEDDLPKRKDWTGGKASEDYIDDLWNG